MVKVAETQKLNSMEGMPEDTTNDSKTTHRQHKSYNVN